MPVEAYTSTLRERLSETTVWLPRTEAAAKERHPEATMVTGVTVEVEHTERTPDLELFQTLYAGTDRLPLSALKQTEVTVTNVSGVYRPDVAEHAIGGYSLSPAGSTSPGAGQTVASGVTTWRARWPGTPRWSSESGLSARLLSADSRGPTWTRSASGTPPEGWSDGRGDRGRRHRCARRCAPLEHHRVRYST